MGTINISKRKTKKIKEYYRDLTLVTEYKCFCKKYNFLYMRVWGKYGYGRQEVGIYQF